MKFIFTTLATGALAIAGCSTDAPTSSSSYLQDGTGEPCEPDMSTMVPTVLRGHRGQGNGKGGHNSPTGIAGDNIDDPHSGKVDCYWDGNSGQGNDKDGCAPPPGCDANGCCENPGGDDGDDSDGDDGSPGDPDAGTPTDTPDNDGGSNSGGDDSGTDDGDSGDGSNSEEPPVIVR